MLDIVLNRTQRKTPTVIRAGFKISRIRSFYMRKVRFTSDGFSEKFDEILKGFPNINDVHPFHRDLMDTLYEKNHFKVSLAAISRSKAIIESVQRDYVRLLKFGQSLFQCKQLKRAALGRMATIVKKLKDPLAYLEQVRQHLGRLPSIDPNTRTLLICGYPNVGKSSFLRCITKAYVDVQPYAFTTKSLYVGHFDYKYLRYQAIDTPGILDRPTEEMNNIEMQSIYAIAHIRSCVLYFMDLSEQCGFSVEDQVKLFSSIKPLFANKSVVIVINKIDIIGLNDLSPERQALISTMTEGANVEMVPISCAEETGIMEVRNLACEKLLAARIDQKLKNNTQVNNVLNKIHVARPTPRDDVSREAFIPQGVNGPKPSTTMKDIELQNGGPGVFNINLKENYLLENDEWNNDIIPEILNGRNIADFFDEDIVAKMEALEEEEEKLEEDGFYNDDIDEDDEEDEEIHEKAEWIRKKQKLMINQARQKKHLKNRALIPRKDTKRTLDQLEKHLTQIGYDATPFSNMKTKKRRPTDQRGADVLMSEVDSATAGTTSGNNDRYQSDRLNDGVSDDKLRNKAAKLAKIQQRARNRMARVGEADRHIAETLPKHLYAGKRGMGKTQRR